MLKIFQKCYIICGPLWNIQEVHVPNNFINFQKIFSKMLDYFGSFQKLNLSKDSRYTPYTVSIIIWELVYTWFLNKVFTPTPLKMYFLNCVSVLSRGFHLLSFSRIHNWVAKLLLWKGLFGLWADLSPLGEVSKTFLLTDLGCPAPFLLVPYREHSNLKMLQC